MDKELRTIIKALEGQGFEVTRTGSGHYEVRKAGRRITTLTNTPSDWRSRLNELSYLRRAGFTWRRK
jgi:hypothetical protein